MSKRKRHQELADELDSSLDALYEIATSVSTPTAKRKVEKQSPPRFYFTRQEARKAQNKTKTMDPPPPPPVNNNYITVHNHSFGTPKFDAGKDDIEEFFNLYEDAKQQLCWDDNKAKQMLPSTFIGKGRNWLQVRIQKGNWNTLPYSEFKKNIVKAFTRIRPKVDGGQVLRDRVQERHESVKDYVFDKLYLIHRYEPTMEERDQVKVVGAGLLPYFMDRVGTQVFETVDTLLDALVSVEANKLNIERRKQTLKGSQKPKLTLKEHVKRKRQVVQ